MERAVPCGSAGDTGRIGRDQRRHDRPQRARPRLPLHIKRHRGLSKWVGSKEEVWHHAAIDIDGERLVCGEYEDDVENVEQREVGDTEEKEYVDNTITK